MIVADPHNKNAAFFLKELAARGLEDVDDVVVVLGGDGFLLKTASHLGYDRIYLGLNAGHLGFLLNDVDTWDHVAAKLRTRAWTVRSFPLLEAQIHTADGTVVVDQALNDVYLERMTGQTARLELWIDGTPAVERLVADGIIFSTALGSTAYAYSAGGPACHPALRLIGVTPICPHLPRMSPLVLPPESEARVIVHQTEHRPVRAVVDGRDIADVRSVQVRVAKGEVRLAHLAGHDFTARMIRKLLPSTG